MEIIYFYFRRNLDRRASKQFSLLPGPHAIPDCLLILLVPSSEDVLINN